MFDSLSEGNVFYGRAFLLVTAVLVLSALVHVL